MVSSLATAGMCPNRVILFPVGFALGMAESVELRSLCLAEPGSVSVPLAGW